ncbi:MAG: hypothetical protein V9G20_09120 [Candidatus Promineifilaceae bacterium]
MRAHAHDLRAEIKRDFDLTDEAKADELVHQITKDWPTAALAPAHMALCIYADKLTRTPATVTEADVDNLRQHGFSDRAIHDATQIISYFNYINRIADGLDVALEDFVHAWEQGVPER